MDSPVFPRIDFDALRSHLKAAGLNDRFGSIEGSFIGRFSNDVWRIELDNGVRLIAKHPYRSADADNGRDVERGLYRHVAGRRGLPLPRFVADLDGLLILEYHDLEPFSFRESVGQGHAEAAVDALADWHAAWWERAPDAAWLPNYAQRGVREAVQDRYDAAWRRNRERLLEFAPEFAELGDALVGRLVDTLEPLARPATLTHGDAHAENLPQTSQGVLLLDWQEAGIANPGLDLAVFMTMSYRAAERSRWERRLVARHAARVRAHGCEWPDPWADYRLGLLRRVARIVEIADVEFISLPWVFRRTAVSALVHGVRSLIR